MSEGAQPDRITLPALLGVLISCSFQSSLSRRVRAAGWSNEDRKDLLGHKNGDITTHYSRVEIDHLREVVESITKKISYNSPTLRVVGE